MVLVFLKNLLFPPKRSTRARVSADPVVKYGSFNYADSPSPSPSPDSGSAIATSPVDYFDDPFRDVERGGLLSGSDHRNPDAVAMEGEVDETYTSEAKSLFSPRVVSDAIIGLSDGLTVPFALTAGLSTFNDTRVVVYGGLAELIAGSISMGLGGWLAARGESEYYHSTAANTLSQITAYHSRRRTSSAGTGSPTPESQPLQPPTPPIPSQINAIFTPYSLPPPLHAALLTHLLSPSYPPAHLLALLMRQHHNLPPPSPSRAYLSASTIAGGYFFGGFVPLLPYFFVERDAVLRGLAWSVGVMGVCLACFGAWKTLAMDNEEEGGWEGEGEGGEGGRGRPRGKVGKAVRGAVEMVMVGGVAAGGAMGIVRLLGSSGE